VERRRFDDDQGQIFPLLALVISVLIVAVFWLAELGVAGALRAGGQSAADAAALAAAADIRHQAERILREGIPGGIDHARPEDGPARAAAYEYAGRNDARITTYQAHRREARVEVETNRQMGSRAADDIGVTGTRASATARARFRVDWREARKPTPRNRRAALSDAEIAGIFLRNGLVYIPVVTPTALRQGGGCNPGPDVKNLTPAMHDVIAVLEYHPVHGINTPLVIIEPPTLDPDDPLPDPDDPPLPVIDPTAGRNRLDLSDGYRHPACGGNLGHGQGLELYSPENYGEAIRVRSTNHRNHIAARQQQVGLCRPYPARDPGLFALRSSLVCGGRTGDLSPTQVFGGNLRNVVRFEVELIPDEGPLGQSQP
jgi:hypothetical protein